MDKIYFWFEFTEFRATKFLQKIIKSLKYASKFWISGTLFIDLLKEEIDNLVLHLFLYLYVSKFTIYN